MDIRPVDPRDTDWEMTCTSFRVYFWKAQPSPPIAPEHRGGHDSTEFEISGVEVGEVLEWAEATAPRGSTCTVYAVVEQGGERGLVRLAGVDPTTAQ